MHAPIVDIKRFAVHDGPGIRTTLHIKGCPLKCIWCHNPESISAKPQLGYYPEKCIGCGECVAVCPEGAHVLDDTGHRLDRRRCATCGKCAAVCLGEALILYGRSMTAEEVVVALLEDRAFYPPHGGITLSGGECLTELDFCVEVLRAVKDENIHTAIDTCGFVPMGTFEKVLPYTDLFLYDIKAMDEAIHMLCTGHGNSKILENLRYLDAQGAKIEIRIPYVPGYNSDQMEKTAEFLKTLHNITGVRILPYHKYAGGKYMALEMENTLPAVLPEEEEIKAAQAIFVEHGLTVIE